MPGLEFERERLLEMERRKERKRQTDERCGTIAGYMAHSRKHPRERACKACRKAWATYYKEYNARPKD